MVNNREKMRRSNRKIFEYLLCEGFKDIFLKQHTKWCTQQIINGVKIKSQDIFSLFDGICLKDGKTYYIQAKTNKREPSKKYEEFAKARKLNKQILLINVRDRKPIEMKVV